MKNIARRDRMKGMAACTLALLLAATMPLHAEERLPQRNMLIEWRVTGRTQGQQRNSGIRSGEVIVNSNGQVIGRTAIGMGTISTTDDSDSVQQLQVSLLMQAPHISGQPHTLCQDIYHISSSTLVPM